MTKKVALVGMAHTTRDLAPWDDEEWEIWTLNESPSRRFGYVKRVSRHFQLHTKWNYDRDTNQNDPEHRDWLRVQKDFPIYMQEVDPDVPASVKYPLDEVFDLFKMEREGPDHWKEFTSTFPYMLALAHLEGFDEIGIYGFEMGSETEYAYQRSSAHLWLGILRGIWLKTGKPNLIIPDNAKLLGWNLPLYGYDMMLDINPMEVEIDRNKFRNMEREILGRIAELEGMQKEITTQIQAILTDTNATIQDIQEKPGDQKLKERRIKQKQEEHNAQVKPLGERLHQFDSKKLDLTQELNYYKGMADYCQMVLDRIHSQKPGKVEGPHKGVQLR